MWYYVQVINSIKRRNIMNMKVLATVSGREITEADLNAAMSRLPQDRKQYFVSEEGKKQLLQQLITWELMYDYALEKDMDQKEEYKTQLEEAKKGILSQMVINDVLSNIHVDDKEIEEYYNANKSKFSEGEQVSARHILVDTEEKANEIISAINNGLSFEEAANTYSSCPSKAQGGSLGHFGRGMMVPEFEEAAFSLEQGVLSQPVKTQFGYHLIIVDHKHGAGEKPLSEVKGQITQMLVQEKQNKTYMNFVEGLQNKYKVEIK
jgi:peptidyl-prolyl cis-trans isomerase C